jgi:hypothetical protein
VPSIDPHAGPLRPVLKEKAQTGRFSGADCPQTVRGRLGVAADTRPFRAQNARTDKPLRRQPSTIRRQNCSLLPDRCWCVDMVTSFTEITPRQSRMGLAGRTPSSRECRRPARHRHVLDFFSSQADGRKDFVVVLLRKHPLDSGQTARGRQQGLQGVHGSIFQRWGER